MLVVALCMSALSGCTTVKKGWQSTKDTVGGLFGGSGDKAPPPDQTAEAESASAPASTDAPAAPMTGGLFMGSGSASSAFQSSPGGLSAAPAEPAAPAPDAAPAEDKPAPKKAAAKAAPAKPAKEEPKKEAATEEPKPADTGRAVEGLVADRTKASYTEQVGRRDPVTVRPLNENAQTAEASAPPRPAAAPVEQVGRLEGQLAAPSQQQAAATAPAAEASGRAAPRAADLVDRLSAPAPAPAESMPDTPRAPVPVAPAPVPAQAAVAPAAPAPVATSVQPLIPSAAPRQIAGYGDDTVVVDSSGTRGGRNVLGTQVASAPRLNFDPGSASVSSEIGTVLFAAGSANLSAQGKVILADAARLRAQVDGAIRIVGRGDQAAARAAAVSKELRRLGVPAARLYDGGADSTMLGDAADIYLDY
ncbi:MAG: hypothetical protein JNM81_17630 [Rhodospirillaceae bacterium]|nr:hypothetical protein [Rhodospirillaceae bacterium]